MPLPPSPRPSTRRVPLEAQVTEGAVRSFTPTDPNLVEAVYEESIVESPDDAPPPPLPVRADPHERLVPDWAASFALILLVAVGAWAVLSRFW